MGFDLPDNDFYAQFNPKIEILQEISNIGVGHAATALSQLLNRKVEMSIPRVRFVSVADVADTLAESSEEIVAGILQETAEDSNGMLNMLLIFNALSVRSLLNILTTKSTVESLEKLDEVNSSIIKETGNILLLQTISAINSFAETKWFPSPPILAIDMVGALTDELITHSLDDSNMFLLVEVDVFTDEETIKGDILLLPDKMAMKSLMSNLFGMEEP